MVKITDIVKDFVFTESTVLPPTEIGRGYYIRIDNRFYMVVGSPSSFVKHGQLPDQSFRGYKFKALEIQYLSLNSRCVEEVDA